MSADATIIAKRVIEILNVAAPGTFSTTIASTNLDRNVDAITEAVREGAMLIARAIVSNPSHPHRNLFVSGSSTTLTHQGELPDMAGEMDLVEIQPYSAASWITGTPRTVQQIESFRANTNSLYDSVAHNASTSRNSGYYAIKNGRFYFTGEAARGYFPTISRSTVTSILPDEYESTWTALSVGLCVKEGDNLLPIAQFYFSHGQQDLLAIQNNSIVQMLPTVERARQARGDSK